jgi:hypothetical protein
MDLTQNGMPDISPANASNTGRTGFAQGDSVALWVNNNNETRQAGQIYVNTVLKYKAFECLPATGCKSLLVVPGVVVSNGCVNNYPLSTRSIASRVKVS